MLVDDGDSVYESFYAIRYSMLRKRKAEPEPGPEADLGAAELVVVGGEEEGVVGACGAVFGSSTASFRMAEAPVVEAADLGRLFWGEGTRQKKKKQRKEGREEASSRWRRSLWWSEGKKRKKKKKKIWGSDLGRLFWGEGTKKKKKKKKKKKQRNEGKGRPNNKVILGK
ncbi:hypothetical protein TIFTF001_029611 [Ficus carica]|uniref:Uncharacterized protein n=1 Tax=Ficus carica TaxID=3494 RepID=A0AA88IYA6_FICCA|nr:hypothetical protein TIFTF001_029611 [Ficus carica]